MKRFAAVAAGLLVLGLASAAAVVVVLQPPRIAVPESRNWVLRDVTLTEPGKPSQPGATLHIQAGRIVQSPAHPEAEQNASPDAEEAPDLAGLFVAPGLVDMHVHYPPAVAIGNSELWSLLLLAHGVTTVRETGSIDGSIFAVREGIRRGETPGPRIFACGSMLDGESPSFPSNRVVRNAAEARSAVQELAEQGADCVKAYNMLSAETLAAIRAEADAVGLPLIGHAPHSVSLEQAGLVDLQHGTGAVVIDPATIGRSDFLTTDWKTVDDERIAYVARVSLAQGIAHTPTLINSRMRRLLRDGAESAMATDSGLKHLPRFWQPVWSLIWSPPFADEASEANHDFFRARQAALTVGLHAAGVRVHAGTDTLMPYVAPGSSLHGEILELTRAGLSEEDAWRIATRDSAGSLGLPGLGTLAAGAPADLLFLRGDPRDDLTALFRIEAVMADGRLYRRAELEEALARFDAHFQGGFYEAVMGTLTRLISSGFAPAVPHDETRAASGKARVLQP